MAFPTQIFTFSAVCFLIFLSSSSQTSAASKLVNEVCSQTLNYSSKCQNLLDSDPKTKDLEDPKKLAEIVLQMGIDDAKKSYDFINKLVKTNPTEPIKQCASLYNAAAASFKSALGELDEDPLTANYDAKVALDYADSCEEWLAKGPAVPEISARNDQVKLYSWIGYAVTNLL